MIDIFLTLSIYSYKAIFSLEKKGRGRRSNALDLYMFYYSSAKYQQTNQPWVTNSFCEKGLNWGNDKLRQTKNDLRELGLIEDIPAKGTKGKAYVKIKYFVSEKIVTDLGYNVQNREESSPPENPTPKETEDKCLKEVKKNNLKEQKFTKVNYSDSKESQFKNKRIIKTRSNSSKVRCKAKGVPPPEKKSLYIPKRTLRIINYWNEQEHLPNITLNESCKSTDSRFYSYHTGVLKSCCDNIKKFLQGTLYTNGSVVYPDKFPERQRKLLAENCSEPHLLDLIDDWVDILADQKYYPTENQRKTSLLSFLVGDNRSGAPSALLNYCILDRMRTANPVIEDNFPNDSKTIQKVWDNIIGKTTKDDKDEFIKISNHVHELEKSKSWRFKVNSCSIYSNRPGVACIVEYLVDNKEYMKKQDFKPSIMHGKWFLGEILKYSRRVS